MSKPWLIDDGLWDRIEPLLPPWPARAPGPRPVPDRLCLQGILYVLHTGIGWEDLPQELGFGSGMTCWRGCGGGPTPACSTYCTGYCWPS